MVGDYEISYETTQRERERITEVLGIVKKGELKFGYINIGDKGRKSIVLEEGISDEDCKAILSTIIDDAQNIFLNQE
jgi:hypothetical protein